MTNHRRPLPRPANQRTRSGDECHRFRFGQSRHKWAATRQLLPCVLLLFAACATEGKYRGYVDGFVGQSTNQLYAAWGAPLRSAPTPDGGQVVGFLSNVQSGRGFGGAGFGVAACETSFILDRAGTVRQASYRGEACYKS